MERNSKGIAVTVAIVAAIGVSLVAMLAVLNRKDQTVGSNQEIQYDDFAFSVQGVRKMSFLGSADLQTGAQSVYYVVTLKIANHAKRVDYTFKRPSAILVDDAGREFHLSESGQQSLDATHSNNCSGPIRQGPPAQPSSRLSCLRTPMPPCSGSRTAARSGTSSISFSTGRRGSLSARYNK